MFSGLFDLPWWGYVAVTLVLTHITIAAVTIFLHRHQAHRALDLHPIPSHFFRFWLWMTTGMVTKEWAAIHRKHHAKCEGPEDPHSPQQLGINRVLWGGVFLYVKESRNKDTMERYGHGTPDDWMENHIYTPGQKVGIVIMLLIDILCFGIWPGVLIWGIQMIWIPFWAAGVINGLGHYWGYRNFECVDASTNLVPWGILIGGEELHNNHHSFATSAKLSAKWYEFDIGWLYIRILETLGLAKVKKVLPKPKFTELRPAVDLDNLQAVITHRYDVARRYMGSLQSIYREELARLRSSLDSQQVSALKRWFQRDGEVSAQDRASIESALAKSQRLETIYAMRRDLTAVWEKSSASREQLVKQLQDWCHRAEQSGIAQLQEFSLRLRRYAV
ncbi:MAG TPA: fatty acid desaturase [Rhodocyclaceae bacterium]|nr:fatty acid desaturase [Rhodocyclaceae bacterium]HMV52191.1 fatty acid desaturase [Rhodocyclaceae bacterium]HMZ84199.1 fatty acid desaturase [Rhodocyclaceae bacterium]HNA02583.1 fatty acid desaturase [Rhodocyclaceae bacterium]HNB77198.1 fatty acid desaturase [Rhodocyclaceae bacterium]